MTKESRPGKPGVKAIEGRATGGGVGTRWIKPAPGEIQSDNGKALVVHRGDEKQTKTTGSSTAEHNRFTKRTRRWIPRDVTKKNSIWA